MKKIASLLAAVVLLLSVFTACRDRITEETTDHTSSKTTTAAPATSKVDDTTRDSITNVPDTNVSGADTTTKVPMSSGSVTSDATVPAPKNGILRTPVMR